MYACARTRVFSLHMSMCVYMCANVYMCAVVTCTHVYVCVRTRGMGTCVTRMRPCVFYRAFYYIIDHTWFISCVYMRAHVHVCTCICVNKYILPCVYICICARV